MDLAPFVDTLRRDLLAAVDTSDPERAALADRLIAGLDAAVRLAMIDVLAAAAEELTADLAPGSVELRLRGREPQFVVTAAPPPEPPAPPAAATTGLEGDDAATARISLRLPDSLKARIEAAAAARGISVNSWLVGALLDAVDEWVRGGQADAPAGPEAPAPECPAGFAERTQLSSPEEHLMQYTTPGPTALTVRFASGDLRIDAADRPDVEIAVEPHGSSSADRELADATVVEQVGNEIRIIAPDSKGLAAPIGEPAGAGQRADRDLDAHRGRVGRRRAHRPLGALDITTASGDVAAERASSFALVAASADVVCRHVDGDASVKTASGDVHLGPVGGDGHLRGRVGRPGDREPRRLGRLQVGLGRREDRPRGPIGHGAHRLRRRTGAQRRHGHRGSRQRVR